MNIWLVNSGQIKPGKLSEVVSVSLWDPNSYNMAGKKPLIHRVSWKETCRLLEKQSADLPMVSCKVQTIKAHSIMVIDSGCSQSCLFSFEPPTLGHQTNKQTNKKKSSSGETLLLLYSVLAKACPTCTCTYPMAKETVCCHTPSLCQTWSIVHYHEFTAWGTPEHYDPWLQGWVLPLVWPIKVHNYTWRVHAKRVHENVQKALLA